MTITEAYENAGVVHSSDCKMCAIIAQKNNKITRVRPSFVTAIIIAFIAVELWLAIFHLDWVIAGLPQ